MTTGQAILSTTSDKDPLERYYTPVATAAECWKCLEKLRLMGPSFPVESHLDPCAGVEAFGDALLDVGPDTSFVTVSMDIDRSVSVDFPGTDFLDFMHPRMVESLRRTTHVVSNPPFSLAAEFVARARALCPDAVIAFLLPMSYLGSRLRAQGVHVTHRPTHIVHMGRLKFGGPAMEGKGKGGAMQDYALVCWEPRCSPSEALFYWRDHLLAPNPLFDGVE